MVDNTRKRHREMLPGRLQLGGFLVCLALAGLLAVGTYMLWRLASASTDISPPPFATVLQWALAGGFVGGAGRSLYRFIWEVGGCADDVPSYYINKWFLYAVKPVMGSAGGLFFFLAANLGLVALLSEKGPTLGFERVCLTSVLGGVFFEDVFAVLAEMMPRSNNDR